MVDIRRLVNLHVQQSESLGKVKKGLSSNIFLLFNVNDLNLVSSKTSDYNFASGKIFNEFRENLIRYFKN